MANNETFSTVMRGYKKDEVLNYIAGLGEQMQQLKDDLDRKDVVINSLKKELAEAESTSIAPSEEEIEAIKQEVRAEVEQEYAHKIEELNDLLDSKQLELDVQKSVALNDESSEYEKKAREYDECKTALADLMIEARRNADDVLAQANARADMLRSKSEGQFMMLGNSFDVLQSNVVELKIKLQDNLSAISEEITKFESELARLQTEVHETVDSANSINGEQ